MATMILLPGAGGAAAYWHRVEPLLRDAGHDVIAIALPGPDETAGLEEYRELVLERIGERDDGILVAQSMGGFTAALVAERARVRGIVFVNAMIPLPNETARAWWENTSSEEARVARAEAHGYASEIDPRTYFFHDLPANVARDFERDDRDEAKKAFTQPCRFERWPDVPLLVLVGVDDRLFPRDFQHRVAKERLGADVAIEDVRGGHLVALANPREVADRLVAFAATRAQ